MLPAEIARSYDQIARQWLEPHLQTNGIAAFQRALQFVGTESPRFALDVGCGCNPRFLDLLQAQGFRVEGVDISAEMISLARQNRPQATFHLADISTWDLPRQYHFISAWDSTWHLPLAEQAPVLKKLIAGLVPGGVLILTTGGLDAPAEKHDSSLGVPVSYSVLGIPALLLLLDESNCICRHLEYDQWPEKHLVVVAQKT